MGNTSAGIMKQVVRGPHAANKNDNANMKIHPMMLTMKLGKMRVPVASLGVRRLEEPAQEALQPAIRRNPKNCMGFRPTKSEQTAAKM